jgi:hypothetical protein
MDGCTHCLPVAKGAEPFTVPSMLEQNHPDVSSQDSAQMAGARYDCTWVWCVHTVSTVWNMGLMIQSEAAGVRCKMQMRYEYQRLLKPHVPAGTSLLSSHPDGTVEPNRRKLQCSKRAHHALCMLVQLPATFVTGVAVATDACHDTNIMYVATA